jgi:2-polyprenyl-3-methyl-5-hydroxy-6-metoxy-1,4-benzoquinol methylase
MKKYVWGDDPEFFGPQMYYRTTLMLSQLRRYMGHGAVLDAGCGDGVLSFRLAEAGFHVTSVDEARKCITYHFANIKRRVLGSVMSAAVGDLTTKLQGIHVRGCISSM